MILTTENINAVLGLVLKDKTLDETIDGIMGGKLTVLKDVANAAIADPTILVDTVIKVLAATDYEVENLAVLYDTLAAQLEYTYSTEMPKAKVELALNKLDAVLNNAIDDVFVILKDLDNMPALVTELAESGATGSITELVEWVLGKYAFTDDLMNTIVGAIAGIFAGMDANTFKTVNDLLVKILGVSIDLAEFKKGTNLAAYFGEATAWSEVTVNKEYKWGFEAAEGEEAVSAEAKEELFIDIILEVIAPFAKARQYLPLQQYGCRRGKGSCKHAYHKQQRQMVQRRVVRRESRNHHRCPRCRSFADVYDHRGSYLL